MYIEGVFISDEHGYEASNAYEIAVLEYINKYEDYDAAAEKAKAILKATVEKPGKSKQPSKGNGGGGRSRGGGGGGGGRPRYERKRSRERSRERSRSRSPGRKDYYKSGRSSGSQRNSTYRRHY